jgi:hypothetical protein
MYTGWYHENTYSSRNTCIKCVHICECVTRLGVRTKVREGENERMREGENERVRERERETARKG